MAFLFHIPYCVKGVHIFDKNKVKYFCAFVIPV